LWLQAGFQAGVCEGESLPTENKELALSNGKREMSHSKKQNLDNGVYTKDGRYLFHDLKEILSLALTDEAAD